MSGMINNASADEDTGVDALTNPLLREAVQEQQSKLTPENRDDYNKIVVAGQKIVLANGEGGFLAKLFHSRDPIGDCARGAVALMLIMRKQSQGVMPMKAAIPAASTLMLLGLDFIDHAGVAKIGEAELAQAAHAFANEVFHKLRITAPMIQHMTGGVQAIMADPAKMQAVNMKAGLTRHPLAATPTPLPAAFTPRQQPGQAMGAPQ